MTDILTRHPDDSDEFPLGIGEKRIVILRRDTGEPTQRIDPRLIHAPSFDAIPRKVFDIDDTVIYMPETIGVVDQAAAQPIAPLERVAGAEDTAVHSILDSLAGARAGIDGELEGPQKPPPPLPKPKAYVVPGKYRYAGRHRQDADRRLSPWWGLVIAVGFGLAMWAGAYLAGQAVLAVIR